MLFKPETAPTQDRVEYLTGRAVAHGRRTPSQRAAVAAQLVIGEATLVEPTVKQASTLLDVCVPYVGLALDATTEKRAALASGKVTISGIKPSPTDQLVAAWNAATNSERIEFASRIGVARVWDEAIAPAIG